MKSKLIFLFFILYFLVNFTLLSQAFNKPEGNIVNHLPKAGEKYIGSPGLAILPNGYYVASHDEFGPKSTEFRSAQTRIFLSKNRGESWEKIADIDGQFWSNLFVHRDTLYIMGTHKHHGNVIIRKSSDNGYTWTNPYQKDNGLIMEGEYHTAPMPMVYHNGRIWRTIEYATGFTSAWGKRYSAMILSAPDDANLLESESWTSSNPLTYDSTYLDGHFRAWLEGNAVVTPEGGMANILRVDVPAGHPEMAAIVRISNGGRTACFDNQTGFIQFPGGAKKFTIRYDDVSKRYWSLVNYVAPEFRDLTPGSVRNNLAIVSSSDLSDWTIHSVLLSHPDQKLHGFQYVEWLIDGDDLVYLVRTAYDDEFGGARNNHDANYLIFHRLENFREQLEMEMIPVKNNKY